MNTALGPEKFALVIPTLNEVKNIPVLIDRVQIALARVDLDFELLVVDDDSPDGTAEIVNQYAGRDHRIRLPRPPSARRRAPGPPAASEGLQARSSMDGSTLMPGFSG